MSRDIIVSVRDFCRHNANVKQYNDDLKLLKQYFVRSKTYNYDIFTKSVQFYKSYG